MTNFGFAFLVAITFTVVFETNGSLFERRSGDMADYLVKDKWDDDDNVLTLKQVMIHSLPFTIEVKETSGGRFIEFTKKVYPRESFSFPMTIASKVRDALTSFEDFYTGMGKDLRNGGRRRDTDNLKSVVIRGPLTNVYLVLKENKRGVYLGISSQPWLPPVTIPAQGIVGFQILLHQMIKMFGEELLESQEMRTEEKRLTEAKIFHFGIVSNNGGDFIRITEVTKRYHSSITIPQQNLRRFKEILSNLMSKLEHGGKHTHTYVHVGTDSEDVPQDHEVAV